jgi:TatD DNase family protein
MMIDTHAHLSGLEERGIDTHTLLAGLFKDTLSAIIDISLEPGDLKRRMEEYAVYPQLFFASGLWPHAASIANREKLVSALKADCTFYINAAAEKKEAPRICALGEFGLDHHWNKENGDQTETCDLKGERELMEMQLDTAESLGLPVIIHSRDAAQETALILSQYPHVRGVIHCFSYSKEFAKTFLDMGYYISFTGNITYKNAGSIREACAFIPADRLLLETDCPYLAPVPYRGQTAHPSMVVEVYKTAAEVRKVSVETLSAQIAENAKRLFGI